MIKKLLIGALLSVAVVHAACAQVLPPGYFWGNPKGVPAPPTGASPTAQFDQSFGNIPGSFAQRGSLSWVGAVMAGDCVLAGAGAITCTKSNGVPFGGMAFQAPSGVTITGGAIACVNTPSVGTDCANKAYADAIAGAQKLYLQVQFGTATVLPNTPTYSNGASGVGATLTSATLTALSIDGSTPSVGQRIIVNSQAAPAQNGVYTVTTVGDGSNAWVLTRATDFNQSANMLQGASFFIQGGSTQVNKTFALLNTVTTVGTTAVAFTNVGNSGAGVGSLGSATGTITLDSNLSIPGNVLTANVRPRLLTGRAYYIRKASGNDVNCTGLTDAAYVSGSFPQNCAFATYQRADDVASTLDFNGQQVVYQHSCSDGAQTFTVPTTINVKTGGGTLQVLGCNFTNSQFNVAGADVFKAVQVGTTTVNFDNMTLKGGSLGELSSFYSSVITVGSNVYFDVAAFAHIYVHDRQAIAMALGSTYKIIGGGGYHIFINGGFVFHESCSITITGTPAFSGAFVQAINGGAMQLINFFNGGSATGVRYYVDSNSVVNSFGQGANRLPGTIAGVPVPPADNNGGRYIP